MILPQVDLRSTLLSAHQSLGSAVELRLDALRTSREQLYYFFGSSADFYNILKTDVTTSLVSPSVRFELPRGWALSLAGTWGNEEITPEQTRFTLANGASTPQVLECLYNICRTYHIVYHMRQLSTRDSHTRIAVCAGFRKPTHARPT